MRNFLSLVTLQKYVLGFTSCRETHLHEYLGRDTASGVGH